MFNNIEGIEGLRDAARNILESFADINEIIETMTPESAANFMGAAAAAKKAGKDSFEFGGKTYPVQIDKDVADKISSKMEGHSPSHDEEEEIEEQLTDKQKKLPPGLQKAILKKQGKSADDEEEKEVEEAYAAEGIHAQEIDTYSQKRKDGTTIGVGEPVDGDEIQADVQVLDGEEIEAEDPEEVDESMNLEDIVMEALDAEDEDEVEDVIGMLKKASQAHAGQADTLQKAIDEGKMKELHMDIKAGKTVDQIIQSNGLPKTPQIKKFIQGLIDDVKK